MRLIHLSDLHLGYYPRAVDVNPRKIEGGHLGLRRIITRKTFENLNRAIDYAIENDIRLMLMAGDIFEDVDSSLLYSKMFAEALEKLVRNRIYTVVIAGNHDAQIRRMKRSSLAIFTRELSNYVRYVDVYSVNDLVELSDKGGYTIEIGELDTSVIPLPYVYPSEGWTQAVRRYLEASASRAKNRYKVLLAHVQVDRVRFSEMYSDYSEEMIRIASLTLTDIRPELFNYVALGHIHLKQMIGTDNVYYSGSLNRLRFDEALDEKYFLDVELGGSLRVKSIRVEPIKMYYININLGDYDSVDNIINKISEEAPDLDESLVKIRIYYEDKDRYKKLRDTIRRDVKNHLFDDGVYGYKIEFRYTGEALTPDLKEGVDTSEIDYKVSLKNYIDSRFSHKSVEYRGRLYEMALKYFEEVG